MRAKPEIVPAPIKKAGGGLVGGDVNGPGAPMAKGAMQQFPKRMAAGGAGKIRKDVMTPSGKPIAQKKKGYEY